MQFALLVLLAVVLSASAWAAPGDNVKTDSHYTVTRGQDAWLLCDGVSNAGAETACQPATPIDLSDCAQATFSIGKITEDPGTCVTGIFQIYESQSTVVGEPNVWHKIGELTGVLSPLISEYAIARKPLSNLRVIIGAGAGTPIADADCDEVDIVLTCERPAP